MTYKTRGLKSNLLTYIFLLLLVAGIFLVALIATKKSTDLRSRAQTLPLEKVTIDGVNYELQGKVLQSEAEFINFKNSSANFLNKEDIQKARDYFIKNEKIDLKPPTQIIRQLQQKAQTTSTSFTVTPILFVPQDYWNNSKIRQYQLSITETFQLLRRWYSGALQVSSGYTFEVNPTIVYRAPQRFEYYKCPDHQSPCNNYDGVWDNIQIQLYMAQYPLWSTGKIYTVFVMGAGGWAGGSCMGVMGSSCSNRFPHPQYPGFSGFAIMGDWALDGISDFRNNECWAAMGTACGRNPQRGAVGHELGHTFGLGHPESQNSIMSFWWLFPYTSLENNTLDPEKDVLRTSLFIRQISCTNDAQIEAFYFPERVSRNVNFNAYFTVLNYGWCKWDNDGKFALKLIKGDVWGVNKSAVSENIVYPAQIYWFAIPMRAPDTIGAYPSIWRMSFDEQPFGPFTGRGRVFVFRDPNTEIE